ncbi:MAG: GNAT family N-acetyltransferase [Terriglobales bacterium]
MQFTVREYRPADFDELWRLDQECFEPGISYTRAELMHYIRRRDAFTLVAEHAELPESSARQIVGFVVAERDRHSLGHIITIDIGGKARRHGLGSRLMSAAEQRLVQLGCPAVFLETAVNNQAAIEFYKRLGYYVIKTIPRYYHNKLDALVMAKKLVSQPTT